MALPFSGPEFAIGDERLLGMSGHAAPRRLCRQDKNTVVPIYSWVAVYIDSGDDCKGKMAFTGFGTVRPRQICRDPAALVESTPVLICDL